MWTATLDPWILREPQLRLPAGQPRAPLSFDWGPVDSADLAAIESTRDRRMLKQLAAQLIRAPYLPPDDPMRAQRIFRVAQAVIGSILRDAARDEKLLRRHADNVRVACPHCAKLFRSVEYLEGHIRRRHSHTAVMSTLLRRLDNVESRVDEWKATTSLRRRDPLTVSRPLGVDCNQQTLLMQSNAVSLGAEPPPGRLFRSQTFSVEADHAKELVWMSSEFCVDTDCTMAVLRESRPLAFDFGYTDMFSLSWSQPMYIVADTARRSLEPSESVCFDWDIETQFSVSAIQTISIRPKFSVLSASDIVSVEFNAPRCFLFPSEPFSAEFDPPAFSLASSESLCMEFNPQIRPSRQPIGISSPFDPGTSRPHFPVLTISLPTSSQVDDDSPRSVRRSPHSSIMLRSSGRSPSSSEKAGGNSSSSAPTIIITPADGIPSDFCSSGSFSSPDEFVTRQRHDPLSPIAKLTGESSSSSDPLHPKPDMVHEADHDSLDRPNLSTADLIASDSSIGIGFLRDSPANSCSDTDL